MVERYRKKLERLYTDTVTVFETQSYRDPESKTTKKKEVEILTDIPCRLSYKSTSHSDNGMTSSAEAKTTIFIAPERNIKEGSKFLIKRGNRTIEAKNSTIPRYFDTHQEIDVEIIKEVL